MSAAPDKAALNRAKVRVLATSFWDDVDASTLDVVDFPSAGIVVAPGDGDSGARAWVYPWAPQPRLGGPLLWATRRDVATVHLVVDAAPATGPDAGADPPAGRLARQAQAFARPRVEVFELDRSDAATLVPADPAPFPAPLPAEGPTELVDLLADAGVEVLVEGGMVRGEVDGLEVARIVTGETTAGVPLDGPLLEVGVGAADRELTAMLHGELPPAQQLERAVAYVRRHRVDGSHHPLAQLVPERWLRAVLRRRPDVVGLADLRPVEGPSPRPNLRDVLPAFARGTTDDGRAVVVACSVGVDVDLVPAAADARAFLEPDAELWLVVPDKDDHPGIRRLAESLADPARVVPVPDTWRTLQPGSRQ
jgi:hypothetical protein